MSTSRQKIFHYIIEQRTATVDELSRVFGVTPANIRHHLSILTRQGNLQIVGTKPASTRGRPTQIYSSTNDVERHNLEALSDSLLSMLASSTQQKYDQYLPQVAELLNTYFKIDLTNPTRRLYSAIQALNQMNYQAHWEAHVENPRIMLGHCPYRSILEKHPELCHMDRLLLERMLGTPAQQTEKLSTGSDGLPECAFLITNRPIS